MSTAPLHRMVMLAKDWRDAAYDCWGKDLEVSEELLRKWQRLYETAFRRDEPDNKR